MGAIDYWCNAFTPDRRALWDAAIETQGISLKVRKGDDDSFADPAAMLARMDALDIDALVLPACDAPAEAGATDYELFATRLEDADKLASQHPGRFAALWSLDPNHGTPGIRAAGDALRRPHFVGLHLHTHSWDRPFDHRTLYPWYALAAEHDVPVVVQAGASGGRLPSECGRPIGIDRPALFFADVRFVLSHTGWPWVDEALAMALKHPNVFLGTAAYPPHHWSPALIGFARGAGRGKTLFGTSFPVVGHRHALDRLDALELGGEVRAELLEGAARRVFTRLAD